MKIIDELLKFKISENNTNLVLTDEYIWKNTVDRTRSHDLEDQIIRFSDKVNELTNTINNLIEQNKLKTNFSVLELFCGNGIVLYMLKQRFPECIPIGVDMLHFEMWDDIKVKYPDIHFIQANFFDIYNSNLQIGLDLMVTYNTWRGWDNQFGPGTNNNMSGHEFMKWCIKNFKCIVADKTIIS